MLKGVLDPVKEAAKLQDKQVYTQRCYSLGHHADCNANWVAILTVIQIDCSVEHGKHIVYLPVYSP